MSKSEYALLQDVIIDADFPDLDLALRRGRHIDRDDAAWYSLLTDAQELLEPMYRRYGCELIHKTDGYFYLLPTGEKVSRKQLSPADMLVGQALALLYLDPAAVERGGVVSQEEVVGQLSAVLGSDALIALFSPGKRKRQDERIAQRNVRQRVTEAVRRLANLGFVELSDANAVRLRAALLRFAEPVRGLSEPAEALAKLVAQGEVALTPDDVGDEPLDDADDLAADDAAAVATDDDEGELAVSAAVAPVVGSAGAAEIRVQDELSEFGVAARGGEEPLRPDDRDAWAESSQVGAPAESSDAAAYGGEEHGADDRPEGLDAWDGSGDSGVVSRPDAVDALGVQADVAADLRDVERSQEPPRKVTTVRRVPLADDDLDWTDILLPEREDAEDGS